MEVKCSSVYVRFKDNHQGQHISNTELSRCDYLLIQKFDNMLKVSYYDKDHDSMLKVIVFNYDSVLEIACEGVNNAVN